MIGVLASLFNVAANWMLIDHFNLQLDGAPQATSLMRLVEFALVVVDFVCQGKSNNNNDDNWQGGMSVGLHLAAFLSFAVVRHWIDWRAEKGMAQQRLSLANAPRQQQLLRTGLHSCQANSVFSPGSSPGGAFEARRNNC